MLLAFGPSALENVDDGDAGSADGHQTRPLLAIATVGVRRGKIGETLALGHEEGLALGILNHNIADIEVRRREGDTECVEGRAQLLLADIDDEH